MNLRQLSIFLFLMTASVAYGEAQLFDDSKDNYGLVFRSPTNPNFVPGGNAFESQGVSVSNNALSVAPVPEPSAIALACLSLLALAALQRLRQRR
jgi:hypothetical protein